MSEDVRVLGSGRANGTSTPRPVSGDGLIVAGRYSVDLVYWDYMYSLEPGGRFLSVGDPFGNFVDDADYAGLTLWRIIDGIPTPIASAGAVPWLFDPGQVIWNWDALTEDRLHWIFVSAHIVGTDWVFRSQVWNVVGDTLVAGPSFEGGVLGSVFPFFGPISVVGFTETSAVLVSLNQNTSSLSGGNVLSVWHFNPQAPSLSLVQTLSSTVGIVGGSYHGYAFGGFQGGRRTSTEGVLILARSEYTGTLFPTTKAWVTRITASGINFAGRVDADDRIQEPPQHPGQQGVSYTGRVLGYDTSNFRDFYRVTDGAITLLTAPAAADSGPFQSGEPTASPLPYDFDHVSYIYQPADAPDTLLLQERDNATLAVTREYSFNKLDGVLITDITSATEPQGIGRELIDADYAQVDTAKWVTRYYTTGDAVLLTPGGAAPRGQSTLKGQRVSATRVERVVPAARAHVATATNG